jgi:mannose-6-phosphate isomerase
VNIGPFAFKENRVRRLYHGGSGIDRLRGAPDGGDGRYPEDWIASCIDANAREFVAPDHGHSVAIIDGREHPFPALLKEHAEAILGPAHLARHGATPAVLTKLLDAAVLLPMQVHPDRDRAAQYFHSPFGKTEAWIILATREIDGQKPHLLLGFNDRLDPDQFRREALSGELPTALDMLHKIEVKPGDVYVVYGGMPHAIGPGITMVEVMEPTDLMVLPERNCFGVVLSDEKRYGGLSPDDAMAVFDYTPASREDIIRRCCPPPELMTATASGTQHRLISREKERFFEAQRLRFQGDWQLDLAERSLRVGIVVKGPVQLHSGGTTVQLNQGDSFLLPYSVEDCRFSGDANLILVLPPAPL